MAKAVARLAVPDWEEGAATSGATPLLLSSGGIDALLEVWPVSEGFQSQNVPRALMLDAEKRVCARSPIGRSAGATASAQTTQVSRLSRTAEPTPDRRGLAGLESDITARRPAASRSRCRRGRGNGRGARHGAGAGSECADLHQAPAGDRGGDGAPAERAAGGKPAPTGSAHQRTLDDLRILVNQRQKHPGRSL